MRERLGVVVGGTFNDGLLVRLDPDTDVESLRVGSFCVVEGRRYRYFSTLQDLRLHSTDNALMADPPRTLSPLVRRALIGVTTYATAHVKPMLMIPIYDEHDLVVGGEGPQPVKTIPVHFAHMVRAQPQDFVAVFGEEREGTAHFAIGTPLTMDIPVCIDLNRLVERSTGIFGSTGTGKSFLTRILLAGIMAKTRAVALVFDMHDEYGSPQETEDKKWVRGLRDLLGSTRVAVFCLDDQKTRDVDQHIVIGLNHIEGEDILLLREELGLPEGTTEANLMVLERHFGREHWLQAFLGLDAGGLQELAQTANLHVSSIQALHRKLQRLAGRPYVREHSSFDQIDALLGCLEQGRHVIVQYGRYRTLLDYLLVANIITRRVRRRYEEWAERYWQTRDEAHRPHPLVITVEEAHKFLSPELAHQTIFGTIAREMRKYFVTLLIVDQRPSGIDDEILSQIGTRISGRLNDQRDLEAVLTGVADRKAVRSMLTTLDTKRQVVVFGHAVPMPVQLRTRAYDEEFYQTISRQTRSPLTKSAEEIIEEYWG
ncbi:MAG: ATP-binding protein [Ardenticatenia bacterium]|nr:ATP-binding protein [Ardenticatenia bacterium]